MTGPALEAGDSIVISIMNKAGIDPLREAVWGGINYVDRSVGDL